MFPLQIDLEELRLVLSQFEVNEELLKVGWKSCLMKLIMIKEKSIL
jgi:hypothetical protein